MDITFDITIVIPAYNEQDRLGPTLDKVLDFVQRRGWRAEVIVVDGASQDQTAELAQGYVQRHGIRLIRNPTNRGKGYCVRKGVMEARGRIILFTDADLSAPIEEAPKLLEALDAGADIAIGSRWMRSDLQTKRQSLARQVLGRAFNLLLRMVLTLDFKDTQCGFKAFRRSAARGVFSRQKIERWGFDPEILFLAKRAEFKVAEVPVSWAHDSRTRIHPMADGLRMVCEILHIRWHAFCGNYGLSHGASSSRAITGNPGSASVAESQAGD